MKCTTIKEIKEFGDALGKNTISHYVRILPLIRLKIQALCPDEIYDEFYKEYNKVWKEHLLF